MTLQYIIRNAFDQEENRFQCQNIIELSEELGLDDLAEEMKCDLNFELKT